MPKDMETYYFRQGPCLNCGQTLNGLSGPKGGPDKGSIMICQCSYVMEWDGAKLIELSAELMTELATHPELARALAISRALKEARLQPQRIIVLESREPEICPQCGKLEELRPYGKKQADGKRAWICFDCAHLDEAELHRAFDERMEGKNPV